MKNGRKVVIITLINRSVKKMHYRHYPREILVVCEVINEMFVFHHQHIYLTHIQCQSEMQKMCDILRA